MESKIIGRLKSKRPTERPVHRFGCQWRMDTLLKRIHELAQTWSGSLLFSCFRSSEQDSKQEQEESCSRSGLTEADLLR